eukprot:6117464-Pleurochrysis_carterae.AAC.2
MLCPNGRYDSQLCTPITYDRRTFVPSPSQIPNQATKGNTTLKKNTTGRAGSDGVERRRFSGSFANLYLQYFPLSQTEAAGRPGWCSSSGTPRTERTSKGGSLAWCRQAVCTSTATSSARPLLSAA